MSFAKPQDIIKEGDTVILYITVNAVHAIDVVPEIRTKKGELVENVFQTNYGALKVQSLVGKKYGSKVELSKGWAHALQPTPDLWTHTLPHRTQIMYTPDISMILLQLELKPGSIMIESGTGSGSLSHFLIRAVKPTGHLYTFDFHENRVEQARDEFVAHGLGDFVTVRHQDVCQNGFGEELNGKADAVFLDLPAPHLAIPHAAKALKRNGSRFCSFSPCIEQSQKCCEVLKQYGFTEIDSLEIIQTEELIKTRTMPVIDLEFLKSKKCEWEDIADQKEQTKKEPKKYLTASAPPTVPGHSGFLTFATMPPVSIIE